MTGINHQPLEIRLLYHRFQHFFPDALVSPATETPLDSIPLTIFRRQVSPWCSRSQNPEHAIQKLTGILCVASPRSLVSYCVRLENFPHRIGHIVPSIAVLHEETPLCVFLHYTTKRHFCRQCLVTRVNSRYASSASQSFLGVLRVGLVLAVAASIVLALSLSRLLIRPIRRISETMSIIGSGQFGAHLSLPRRDELGMLAQQLNHMSDELQRLLDEAVHNHTMFIEAKLNALQSQVNPHFLYNTLDNIHWMSEMHHEPEISRMISSLSKLFRLALSTGKTGIWPLSKEIEHVRCYIDILNLRFQGTVTFSLRMEDHLENIDVPALMLQPLIENAVQHGVRDKENGIVSVEIRTEGNQMIYQVRDNGSADADYINHLIQNCPEPGSRKGQALNNLYQRITLRFGQEADFHCVSTEEGSLFELRLPIKRKEERL